MKKFFKFLFLCNKLESIMTKLVEVAALVTTLVTQLEKAKTEILTKIDELQQQLAEVDLPPEAETAFEDLKASVQALDDVVPDPVPEPTA